MSLQLSTYIASSCINDHKEQMCFLFRLKGMMSMCMCMLAVSGSCHLVLNHLERGVPVEPQFSAFFRVGAAN